MEYTWRSPSNLALVKYWGKYGRQLPCNASLSFTLSKAFTETRLRAEPSDGKGLSVEFSFAGQANEAFRSKIVRLLQSVLDLMPFLEDYALHIASYNSFPHSAGIASSASSMSALALCLCALEADLGLAPEGMDFKKRASILARLFSGSACRSVYPYAALWGKHPDVPESSDEYALPCEQLLHPVFRDYRDAILLVSGTEKSVSSTAGHALMQGHPFAQARFNQAQNNLSDLIRALQSGDTERFAVLAEQEAFTLHGLMLNSNPSFILLEPNTIQIIKKMRAWRDADRVPLCFSLDAGPNPHLLYPASVENQVRDWIQNEALPLCEGGRWIEDRVGGD